MPTKLTIPEIGESITEVFINQWLKGEGDRVEKDETVAELESDKATVELPAPVAGVITKILKKSGDSANVGDAIAEIDENGQAAPAAETRDKASDAEAEPAEDKEPKAPEKTEQKPAPQDEPKQQEKKKQEKQPKKESKPEALVMPAARRAMEMHNLRPDQIKPTGEGGRITIEDVERHLEQTREAQTRAVSRTSRDDRTEETLPMSPMRQTIARRLVQAQQTAALLTTFNEIDMQPVMALRKQHGEAFQRAHGVKLGFMSFFVRATVDALSRFPQLNAVVKDGRQIVYRNYFDIGIAVSTDKGLVVPIIRDADQLSFAQIEQTINSYAERARDGKIEPEDVSGGTFTITNGGIFGSLLSTPIVNPPQSGVLGMHTIQERPIALDGRVVIRPMMYVALTYDHRIVDGREAVTFLRRIKEILEEPARLVMEL